MLELVKKLEEMEDQKAAWTLEVERAKAEALHSKEQSQLESAVRQQLERQLHDVQQIAVDQQKRGERSERSEVGGASHHCQQDLT